jgi:hypothetical protein
LASPKLSQPEAGFVMLRSIVLPYTPKNLFASIPQALYTFGTAPKHATFTIPTPFQQFKKKIYILDFQSNLQYILT